MKKYLPIITAILFFILGLVLVWVILSQENIGIKEDSNFKKSKEGFCGQSTYGQCSSNSDCISGGCSGQICQSNKEESIITTCEYTDCYNAKKYNLECRCINEKCQWYK